MASDFDISGELVAEKVITTRINASFYYKSRYYTDIIKFSNTIIVDKERNKDEQNLHYKW